MKNRLGYMVVSFLLTVAVAVLLHQSYVHGIWRVNYVSSEEYPIQGLDVSHHQGKIRWDDVPSEQFQFVYMKATEGGDFKDKRFTENWHGAKDNGFKVGAYHFFTLCRPGIDQAKNFIETVPNEADAMPPVIDLEFVGNCSKRPEKEKFLKELDSFVQKINVKYKVPVIYTTYDFFNQYLEGTSYADLQIWIRDIWGNPEDKLSEWHIWQYADNARIKGIDTVVDLNAMNEEP